MAFDLMKVLDNSASRWLKRQTTKVINWAKRNPLKALGVAVGLVIGAVALFYVLPLAVGAIGAFLSFPLLAQIGILLTLSALFTFVITTIQVLWTFDWLKSDEDIDKEVKQAFDNLYGLTGGLLGKSLGYLVCGALPGTVQFAFNKSVGAAIFDNLGEEAKQELSAQLAALARATFRAFMNAYIGKQFKSARRYLKKKPDHPISKAVRKEIGEKAFKRWGEKQDEQFTLAKKLEKRVDRIKDPNLKKFTEQFLEEFSEGCIEAGYIVVNTVESAMATQAMMNKRKAGIDANENVVIAQVS